MRDEGNRGAAPRPAGHSADAAFAALVVDDDAGIRQTLRLCLEAMGGWALGVGSGAAALEALERRPFDVVLLDLWLGEDSGLDVIPELLQRRPDTGVVVITAFASYDSAVEAIRRGAADYLPKPFTPDQVRLSVQRVLEQRALRGRVRELEAKVAEGGAPNLLETRSAAFASFLDAARRVAATQAVVLLRGESGTGKNVFARWIRDQSPRRDAPFVAVNCPSLSTDLMSSALFGHRRGAFTGAVADAQGKVQEAEGGTLFLDEVGDLSLDAQARLLRFLNDQTYERLGEPTERRADVRLVAATNQPLEALVAQGRFRQDLLYRLDVLSLTLPALRDRADDIEPLAEHFLVHFAARQARADLTFSDRARRRMRAHRWPGNLRELRNAVERAVILTPGDVIEPSDLGLGGGPASAAGPALGEPVSLEAIEREHIARVVLTSPTLEQAAKTLGIDATTLQRKRRKYGLV